MAEANETVQMLDTIGTDTLIALLTTNSRTEAASQLGIARNTLYERIEKYNLNEHIAKIPSHALSVLQQGSVKAANNFVDKLDHRDAKISLDASKEILDRVGVGVQKSGNNVQVNVLNNIQGDKDKYEI